MEKIGLLVLEFAKSFIIKRKRKVRKMNVQAVVLQRCLSSQVQKAIYITIWEKTDTIKGNKYRYEIAKVQGKTFFELSIAKSIVD